MDASRPPLLICLPDGLCVSGVTMWAARLAGGLVARGREVGLILHREPAGAARLDLPLDARIRVYGREDPLPRLDELAGDLSAIVPRYSSAVRDLAARGAGPVVVSPNLHGDCYGAAAALCLADADLVRLVGWQHSDIEYNSRVLAHYEPVISRFAAVSDAIQSVLAERIPARAADVANVPYGVEAANAPSVRAPLGRDGPLRLIYTGRIEHEQKRILSLVHLSDLLAARGVAHCITIAGDGPAAGDLAALARERPSIRVLPAAAPREVQNLLDQHHAFVLPSRYEGLSVAMLEAMARGCVPILARTRSGAMQAVETGYNGEVADVVLEADERETAAALAESIRRHLARPPAQREDMRAAAHHTIVRRFSLDEHISRVEALLGAAAAAPARHWPAGRPCAFSAGPGAAEGSGSVPPDGPARLRALLAGLAGCRVIIHGTGQHTLQMGAVLAASPAEIVALTDDDRQQHGRRLWNWRVVAPAEAGATGATEVIISSHMHQEAIWARRNVYEAQGLRVHRIY
jgi:glycosyltransferase involved in cell wall biosynthesis